MSLDSLASSNAPASEAVSAGLEVFVKHLIDYAGLFPPAKLPFDDTVTNYAAYRRSEDAWMLGAFICPAQRLGELAPFTDLFSPQQPTPIAMLGSGGTSADAFIKALREDLASGKSCIEAHEGRVRIEVVEVRLPEEILDSERVVLDELAARVVEEVISSGLLLSRLHLELPFSGDWRRRLESAARAVAPHVSGPAPLGMKLRCGGVTADAFPTPDQIAHAISELRDARVPFKATAGLHHPIRHYDKSLEVMQHGFLNVFGAAALAHALDLSEPAIRQVVRSEQRQLFQFDQDGFAFQDLRISVAQLRAAREKFARSYGSCSFDEPRHDLRVAGWL